MHIFVLIAVKTFGQSYVQDFVAKSAASPPRGAVGHDRKRPLCRLRPVNKDQRESGFLEWRSRPYNFSIVVWGCGLALGAEGEDGFIAHSI